MCKLLPTLLGLIFLSNNSFANDDRKDYEYEIILTMSILAKDMFYQEHKDRNLTNKEIFSKFREFLSSIADCQWEALEYNHPLLKKYQVDLVVAGSDIMTATDKTNEYAISLIKENKVNEKDLLKTLKASKNYLRSCMKNSNTQFDLDAER